MIIYVPIKVQFFERGQRMEKSIFEQEKKYFRKFSEHFLQLRMIAQENVFY